MRTTLSTQSFSFWHCHMDIFNRMKHLFGTEDPRYLFGNECFEPNCGHLTWAQETLVSLYCRQNDSERGTIVNLVANLLQKDHERVAFASYIAELGYPEPTQSLAFLADYARSKQKEFTEQVAQRVVADEEVSTVKVTPPSSQTSPPKPEKNVEFGLLGISGKKPLHLPAKGQDAMPDLNCGQQGINFPLYFGEVKPSALAIGLRNSHKGNHMGRYDKSYYHSKDGRCARCGNKHHNTVDCPDGGSIKYKKDKDGKPTDEYIFVGNYYRCFCCSQREGGGHFAETCPYRHPDWTKGACYNCAQFGHRIGDCPEPRRAPDTSSGRIVLPAWEMRKKDESGKVVKIREQFATFREVQRKNLKRQNCSNVHRLFMGNLALETQAADIAHFLRGYEIADIQMMQGYAFVDFYYKDQAEWAKRLLNRKKFMDNYIVLKDAYKDAYNNWNKD